MTDLKTFIINKLPELEEIKKIALERMKIVNDFMDQAVSWLNDYKREGLLDFKVKEDKSSLGLIGKSVEVIALGQHLWIRQIIDPKVFIIRIEQTDISYKDGKWLYKKSNNDLIVNNEIFEEILIKELSKWDFHY